MSAYFHEELSDIEESPRKMKDTLKVIEKKIADYSDSHYYDNSGYNYGYIIIEVSVDGKVARFKIPAYQNSSYGEEYQFDKAVPVKKTERTVEVWENA